MKQNFVFPASGWRGELSQRAQKEIAKHFPKLPVDKISSEAGWYVIMRDTRHSSPAEARGLLRSLRRQTRKLYAAVQPEALGPLRGFVSQSAGLVGSPATLEDLQEALFYFDRAFLKAITFIPKGRPRSPKERLVRTLAGILRGAGEVIDARPKGTFCRLVDIVLRDVKEKPSDVRKLVEPIVRELENSSKKLATLSKTAC